MQSASPLARSRTARESPRARHTGNAWTSHSAILEHFEAPLPIPRGLRPNRVAAALRGLPGLARIALHTASQAYAATPQYRPQLEHRTVLARDTSTLPVAPRIRSRPVSGYPPQR